MVRTWTLGMMGLVTLAGGCTLGGGGLVHDSTLYTAARGVALHDADIADAGDDAQVGMNGTTCAVETDWAMIGTDYDYTGGDETVQDAGVDANGDVTVVVTSDKGVHLQTGQGYEAASTDYEIGPAYQGRLLDEGAVALIDVGARCAAEFVGTADDGRVYFKPELCEGPHMLETDPTTGATWLGSDQGLFEVLPNDVVQVTSQPASLVAYDPYTDLLYTATYGGAEVRAVDASGAERWTTDVGGTIGSLDDMGVELAVAVSVTYDDGTGAVVMLDGLTGADRDALPMMGDPGRLVTSRDGSQLALVSPDKVDFYRVGSDAMQLDWAAIAAIFE